MIKRRPNVSLSYFNTEVFKPYPVGRRQPSRPIYLALHPTFEIFSPLFDVDFEEVPLQLQIEIIDIQCSENFKSKFLDCQVFDFYKNHVFLSEQFPQLYPPHPTNSECV